MRVILGFTAAALLALLLGGCGAGSDDFSTSNLLQKTVVADSADSLTIQSGGRLDIPAGTFEKDTVVIFANYFTGAESNFSLFPTPSPAVEDVLSGMVINTPVDALMQHDLTLQFQRIASSSPLTVGKRYRVYRFDFENAHWNQWGSTVAVVQAGGDTALATLPTTNMRGFVGSLAIFAGLEEGGAVTPTVLNGTVVDQNGDPVATDVALYLNVGGLHYPVAVSNGRVPAVTYPDGSAASIANTVDSAADGTFSFSLADSMIGQLVSLDFGFEDTTHATQQNFDLLAPATSLSNVETMVIRFGDNNIRSKGVRLSN